MKKDFLNDPVKLTDGDLNLAQGAGSAIRNPSLATGGANINMAAPDGASLLSIEEIDDI